MIGQIQIEKKVGWKARYKQRKEWDGRLDIDREDSGMVTQIKIERRGGKERVMVDGEYIRLIDIDRGGKVDQISGKGGNVQIDIDTGMVEQLQKDMHFTCICTLM